MITAEATREELLAAFNEPVQETQQIISGLTESRLNQVPWPDSWTAAQLVQHVTKSVAGIAQVMTAMGKPAGRDPGERIGQLKNMFLDYTVKMKSPESIVPEPGPYNKEDITNRLQAAATRLRENAANTSLTDLVEGLPLGPVTKLELLHFVVYHTMRHLHQLKKIVAGVEVAA